MPEAEILHLLYGHVIQHAARCLIYGYEVIILQGICKADSKEWHDNVSYTGSCSPSPNMGALQSFSVLRTAHSMT
jgi:hypothetical protein